eukprot:11355167-Karenia_brevis.AAC.1
MALQPHPQNRTIASHTVFTKHHTDPSITTRTSWLLVGSDAFHGHWSSCAAMVSSPWGADHGSTAGP